MSTAEMFRDVATLQFPPAPAERPRRDPLPVIGLYLAYLDDLLWQDSARLRAMAAEAALQGARLGVFGTDDVDFEAGSVCYRTLGPGGWVRWQGPLPDVVMNRMRRRTGEDRRCAERLRAVAPFTTRPLPGKHELAEALLRTPVARHVPPFREVGPERAAACISAFLDTHSRAVLKPSGAGRRGRQVLRDGDDLVVRELGRGWRLPSSLALVALAARVAGQSWILQRYVVSRTRDGRAFDVRVHVHRDGNGRWAVVRAYVRLSEAGLLVSNTSRGGYQGDLEPFFANLEGREALIDRLRRLGVEAAEAVDAALGGEHEEFGVDLLVDPELRPWIAEVNAGPQSRFHEFDRARFAVAYALRLAARRRADGQAHIAPGIIARGPAAVGFAAAPPA